MTEKPEKDIQIITAQMKADSYKMAVLSLETRNKILENIKTALWENKETVLNANKMDMEAAEENQLSEAVKKRLKFDEQKLKDVICGIQELIKLSDPVGKVLLKRQLDEGLFLHKVTCPIGVIGIIFEARPDALVQISSLCIKSGNCAVLKGGKETYHTNKALFQILYQAAMNWGAPQGCMFQATNHDEIEKLLACHKSVDLLIPRGSNSFVQYIMNHTRIPVMGHADGVCHTYVDKDADLEKAIPIIIDAKTQYTAACNSTETLLLDKKLPKESIQRIIEALKEQKVRINGNKEAADLISGHIMEEEEFHREYLDLEISIKLVDGVDEAISHINRFGSHHTDCILTENKETAEKFMQYVDSAGVYLNCSTRFADGFRYGFGAEVGISTGKLHARGPVGLEGLTTYKYKLYGKGQIVESYSTGKCRFHFEDLS